MRRLARGVAALIALVAIVLAVALATADPEPLSLTVARQRVGGDYAELADGPVRYAYTARDPARPLLVLVHGAALNSLSIWDPLLAALEGEAFGVLRFDSYGQGYSARPDVRHDASLYVRQIDGLLALARVQRPIHLVGYSMGGLIAAEYAAHRPQRVATLTLIAPAGLDTRLRMPVRIGAFPVIGEAVYRLRGAEILLEGYERMAHAHRYLAHVRAAELPWLKIDGTGRSMLSQLRALPVVGGSGAYAFVAASDIPVLAVFGAEDATVPPSSAALLTGLVPGAQVEVVVAASHALVYDHAAAIAPLLVGHVGSNAAGDPIPADAEHDAARAAR